eukprot:COSAG01_NODE_6036_length_3886_cov_2.965672_1_plen_96_part_00
MLRKSDDYGHPTPLSYTPLVDVSSECDAPPEPQQQQQQDQQQSVLEWLWQAIDEDSSDALNEGEVSRLVGLLEAKLKQALANRLVSVGSGSTDRY